jgi:hypothetical protein
MYSSFTFRLADEGAASQHIVFTPTGGESVAVAAEGVTFSQELEPRFRQMYQLLVESELVPDTTPILQV